MHRPKGVGVVSAQLSGVSFQALRAEKPQFIPLLGLLVGKEASKGLPCAFQLSSGPGNLSVKMKMCPVYASYLLSASEHPQRAATGVSQETEACHLIVTAGLTLASVAGWGPRV